MDRPGRPRRGGLAVAALIVATVAAVGGLVALRRGGLTWDDADYLQRGLRLARLAGEAGPAGLPATIVRTIRERPKPPMFIAWIEAVAMATGRRNFTAILLGATAVPYALLLGSAAYIARRLHGPRAVPVALACLIASPMSLAYGSKVMVETFLSLWTLWTFFLAACVIEAPTRRRALGLGLALGLAALTKVTVVLFLSVPAIVFVVALRRREVRPPRDLWAWIVLPALAIAGPWYALNARAAVVLALEASRYNLLAEVPFPSFPPWKRAVTLAESLPGWPLLVAAGLMAIVAGLRRRRGDGPAEASALPDASRLALLGVGSGALILMIPTYFEARFLLPAWPLLALALGAQLRSATARVGRAGGPLLGATVALAMVAAWLPLRHGSTSTTHWEAARLIDDLVAKYRIRVLANIGDAPDWNICKTALANEFRADPSDCFVLRDLSRCGPAELEARLGRLDAVVVLGREEFPPGHLELMPGLNRAYRSAAEALAAAHYDRVTPVAVAGLPPLSVYIRRR